MTPGAPPDLVIAEKNLIDLSAQLRALKDLVKSGARSDEDAWPLIAARKEAYEQWRALADPLVAQGLPLSEAVLKALSVR